MYNILLVVQAVLSVLLAIAILTQSRGAGLSATFGGSGGFFVEKRGAEKVLAQATIVLAVLFVMNALLFIIIS